MKMFNAIFNKFITALKVKHILKRIYRPLRIGKNKIKAKERRINEVKAFHYAKTVLNKGVYYVPSSRQEFRKIDKYAFLPQNLFHFYINLQNDTQAQTDFAEFNSGQGKTVLLMHNKAVGFYFTKRLYDFAKKNYHLNEGLFNYPHIRLLSFDDKQNCVVMERIFGISYEDPEHDKIIIRDLLQFLTEAAVQTKPNGTVTFLQHGDAKRNNIVWNGEQYKYIDLDNTNYYPPLFDVFHYLCDACYNLKEILSILNSNMRDIERICGRANIDFDNFLDYLFYEYVSYFKEINCCFEDFKFLTVENTSDFPKTNALLRSIKL